jgi:hypothetical protein
MEVSGENPAHVILSTTDPTVMSFKGMIRDNAPPMVFPPYRGGGV